MHKLEQFTFYTICALLITCLGSFLFGYQTAVISGALSFLARDFSLSLFEEGFVVSIILLGAILGVLIAGFVADHYGRKNAILLPAALFSLGSAIVACAPSISIFIFGRFITGIAVGLISMTAPLYLAEIAPTRFRGAFVTIHQLAVTIGILVSFCVNYYFAKQGSWREMFGLALIPSILQFVIMFFFCESPSWLLSKGHKERAITALQKLRKDLLWHDHVHNHSVENSSSSHSHSCWSALFKPGVRYVLLLGILLNMFQQITGINTVIYYAPKIFQMAGFASIDGAILAAIGIGIINVLATLVAVWLLDKLGRRILLFIGIGGMMASLILLSLILFSQWSSIAIVSVISLMGYVAFFAIGLGPVTVVIVSEIYPLRIRGRAMSIATMANWFFNYLMSFVFLDLMSFLGAGGVFLLYAFFCLAAGLFVYYYIPETKGKSLEQIEKSL